jgi:uncharacterized metal-binding protein
MERISKDALPDNCPMKTSPETIAKSVERYRDDDVSRLYVPATITEKEAYHVVRGVRMAVRPRIKELIEFCRLLKIERIGIAFCAGLRDEAARLSNILEDQGFVIASALCKCGGVDKTLMGVTEQNKIRGPEKFEAGCNPLLQAELLNNAETEINVIVGLCLGHDMLFTMNSKAPVTTLIVKDRLLGHNPVMGLYSAYHKSVVTSQRRT